MEIKISQSEKDGQERKGSVESMKGSKELTPRNVLVLNDKRLNNTENFTREPFIRYIQNLDRSIPKHIITFDEKYLLRCLELVYASAMTRTSCTSRVPEYLSSRMSTLFEGTSPLNFNCDLSEFPLEAGIVQNGTIGTLARSKGGLNLLKSPLFRQSVFIENGTNSSEDNISTSLRPSISSIWNPEKRTTIFESERFKLETKHERNVSLSNTYSLSGSSSFSLFGNLNRGMLQCAWKAGLPHFVFSLDDHNEIYIANILKSKMPNNNGFDYMYTFLTNEGFLVGKMRVSTSFKLCPNNSQIKETEFVLFGEDERDTRQVQTSISHNSRKSKRLSKKISEVFNNDMSRERGSFKYAPTNENTFIDLSISFSPNLELAAVIVKEHVCVSRQEPQVGGWGIKFLKKTESEITPCDCFTSMNIVIPADFHGGPRDRIGGPSSLVERWRCGGKCDCGGWDIGCPIKVLDSERSKDEISSQIDIRVAGLQDSDPVMKMVNIRDDLYVAYFKSDLSALQSLSIAVSIIHSQNV